MDFSLSKYFERKNTFLSDSINIFKNGHININILCYRVVFLTGPTQKSSKYGIGPPQQEKMTKYTGPTQDLLTQKSSKYGTGTPQQDIEYL